MEKVCLDTLLGALSSHKCVGRSSAKRLGTRLLEQVKKRPSGCTAVLNVVVHRKILRHLALFRVLVQKYIDKFLLRLRSIKRQLLNIFKYLSTIG